MKQKTKKIIKIIGKSIFGLITTIAAYIFISSLVCLCMGKLPTVFGCNFFLVQTPSMEDTIHVNDLVISSRVDYDEVKQGDIITFTCIDESQVVVGQIITHRVVEISYDESGNVLGYVTRGDNNSQNDSLLVTQDNFQGKVIYVSSFSGKLLTFLTANNSVYIFIIVIGSLVFFMTGQVKNIVNEKNKVKRDKQLKDLRDEVLKEIESEMNNSKEEE